MLTRETRSREELVARAKLFTTIREYFQAQQVIEVETPLLRKYPVSDPHLANLVVAESAFVKSVRYLQTSPEASLKCLLAQGSGSIYQLSKVFRDDPQGRWHSQEFTMLEWYRIGFDLATLIEDIAELIARVGLGGRQVGFQAPKRSSYRDVFLKYANIDPFTASTDALLEKVHRDIDAEFSIKPYVAEASEAHNTAKDLCLDLIMTQQVQPKLGFDQPEFVCDYPASQSALAKLSLDLHGNRIACRAELFFKGVELANAYDELCDAEEYVARHAKDNLARQALGLEQVPIDEELYAAMKNGLPACAGVALGVDRLFALLEG